MSSRSAAGPPAQEVPHPMSDTLDPPWSAITAPAGPDAPSLAQRAEAALRAGRTGLARPLIAAFRRLDPHGFPGLEAQLMLREGKAADAIALLTPLIDTQATTALLLLRAEARMGLDDAPGAAMDAADAVLLDRHDPVAKAMLGTVLVSLNRFEDAASCLSDALANAPAQPSFRLALSAAQEGMGLSAEALATLDEGRRLHPRSTALHNATALLHIRLGQAATAIDIASATQAMGVADACTLGLLAHALSLLGRHR
jgi:predicted Zn-dependent protease